MSSYILLHKMSQKLNWQFPHGTNLAKRCHVLAKNNWWWHTNILGHFGLRFWSYYTKKYVRDLLVLLIMLTLLLFSRSFGMKFHIFMKYSSFHWIWMMETHCFGPSKVFNIQGCLSLSGVEMQGAIQYDTHGDERDKKQVAATKRGRR